jgi:hypothetical protein
LTRYFVEQFANGNSDLSESFPNGALANYYQQDWITKLIKETRTTRDFSPRTITAARWAREQVKRQTQHQGNIMNSS